LEPIGFAQARIPMGRNPPFAVDEKADYGFA
jgi:hypothetical protein